MSKAVNVVGVSNFQEVLRENAGKHVLVDFWADWCGPCIAVAPILDKIAEKLQDQVTLVKIDVDEADNKELSMQYGVMGIPNMLLFEPAEGDDADRDKSNIVGARPEPQLLAWLEDKGVDVSKMAS